MNKNFVATLSLFIFLIGAMAVWADDDLFESRDREDDKPSPAVERLQVSSPVNLQANATTSGQITTVSGISVFAVRDDNRNGINDQYENLR